MIQRLLKYIFIIFLALICIGGFILKPIKVQGDSMNPNLKDGDWVLINKMAYIFSKPRRGDIIIFNLSKHNNNYIIKRIIALESEAIQIISGSIYINDEKLNEAYKRHASKDNFHKRFVPENHFFVLGDNRKISLDSRYEEIGFVSKNDIIGKIIYKW